jgi:hypothetical protein
VQARELERNIRLDTGARKDEELQGRLSGSLAWRMLRGETGSTVASGGSGAVSSSSALSNMPVDSLFQWAIAGSATGASAALKLMASFGDQLIAVHADDTLVWCQSAALIAQVSGVAAATPSAWKRLQVWDALGAVWPTPTAPLVAICAQPGTMRLFAVDASGALHVMIAGPKPVSVSSDAAPALRGAPEKRVSRAVLVGVAPAGVTSLAVFESHLFATTAAGTLLRWSICCDEACALATAALQVPSTTVAPSSWAPVCDVPAVCDYAISLVVQCLIVSTFVFVFQGGKLVAADKLLLSHHDGYAHALLYLSTESPSTALSAEFPPACGVRFNAPSTYLRGLPLVIRVQLSCGRPAGAWLGMVEVGSPNECMFDMVIDLDDLSHACFAPDGTITIEWPLDRVPAGLGTYAVQSCAARGCS